MGGYAPVPAAAGERGSGRAGLQLKHALVGLRHLVVDSQTQLDHLSTRQPAAAVPCLPTPATKPVLCSSGGPARGGKKKKKGKKKKHAAGSSGGSARGSNSLPQAPTHEALLASLRAIPAAVRAISALLEQHSAFLAKPEIQVWRFVRICLRLQLEVADGKESSEQQETEWLVAGTGIDCITCPVCCAAS